MDRNSSFFEGARPNASGPACETTSLQGFTFGTCSDNDLSTPSVGQIQTMPEHQNLPTSHSSTVAMITQPVEGSRATSTGHVEQRRYRCSIPGCAKSYTRNNKLKGHVLTKHQGQKRFACHQCQTKFSTLTDLSRHGTVHDNASPRYTCLKCHSQFKRHDTLLHHSKKDCTLWTCPQNQAPEDSALTASTVLPLMTEDYRPSPNTMNPYQEMVLALQNAGLTADGFIAWHTRKKRLTVLPET